MIYFNKSKKKPISRTEIRRKLYHYCELAEVPKITPHAMRHLKAVKLASVVSTTMELESASRLLGHSPSMFANTYANHQKEEIQESLVEKTYVS